MVVGAGHIAETDERARTPSASTAGAGGDLEKGPPRQPEMKNDPFRDDCETGVKYRTMHWWFVPWKPVLLIGFADLMS